MCGCERLVRQRDVHAHLRGLRQMCRGDSTGPMACLRQNLRHTFLGAVNWGLVAVTWRLVAVTWGHGGFDLERCDCDLGPLRCDMEHCGLSLLHTSEPTRLRRHSSGVFCVKKKY